MPTLPWILLALGAALLAGACRVLIADARAGPGVSMGGEMYFSQLWLLGCLAGTAGALLALRLSWWWFLPAVVALHAASFPLRRVLTALNPGAAAAPPAKDGFKEFLRRTEGRDPE